MKKNIITKLFLYLKNRIKFNIQRLQNEHFEHNLLQALPFWIASFLTGIAAVVYAKLFHWAEQSLQWIIKWNSLAIFIIAPLGFVGSWWLVKKYAPYAKGSGIPQVMASVELANPRERFKIKYLLSFKILIIKIISSLVLVFGGGAIGREGPTIQIAGSIFRLVNRMSPKWMPKISIQNMIMTGAAAGLSAAFNTPLGGVVFAIEELAKVHFNYFKTALFTAVIIAGLTAQWLAGSYLYLGFPKTSNINFTIIFPTIGVAIICGLLSSKLSVIMLKINEWKKKLKTDKQNIIFLIISAWILASLAYFINWEILGSGKEIIERVLFSDDKSEAWYVPLLRMIGSAISFTSGGAGGIFAPALSAGASTGAVFSNIFQLPTHATNVIILVGMVSFLTGITRAPFTSAILVLEMTDRHSLIFYLMLGAMISYMISMLVSKHSLYDNLKIIYLSELKQKRKLKTKVSQKESV